MALRTVGVRLTAEIGEYQSKLRAAAQTTKDFKGELDKAGKKGNLDKVADTAGIVGLGLVGMAGAAIKSAADFDKAMSSVSAATHAPKGELDQLRAAALQAGKDTAFSATQAADGITELSKAGVTTADILGGGLKGALSLAAAGQLSVGEAAETAATALTQFKLQGSQVPHVADLLAAAAGKAQGSVHDMGFALKQSGLVASQFGLTVEDTTGVLGEFANAGLIGSDAGTSLKTMLLALANPSKQTQALMGQLGISFYDTSGKFIGLSGVAQVLQTRLKGLTDQQRQQALGQIFGNDAIRAASVLYADGAAGVESWKNKVNDAGYAAATARKQTDNLAGDLERLKGSLETLAIQSGSGANSGLRLLAKAANSLVNAFGSLPSGIGSTVTVLAGVSGAALLVSAAFIKTRRSITAAKDELISMGPAGEKAAAGIGLVGSAVGKAAGLFAVWQSAMAAADAIAGHSDTNIDAMTAGLEKFGQGADLSGESARVLGSNLSNLTTGFKFLADTSNSRLQFTAKLQRGLESTIPGLRDYNTSLSNTQAQITAVDSSLAGMVTTGHARDAEAAFNRLASVLAVNGVSMEEFRKQFPAYTAAVESSGGATKSATGKLGDLNSALSIGADAQDKYATEADAVAGAARRESGALAALHDQLKKDTDPTFALIDAQSKLKDAQKAYSDAVKAHGSKSAEARGADVKLAQAALELQGAVGNLAGSFNGKLDPAFRATLKAAGLTDSQIHGVEKAFGDAKKSADKYTGKYAADVSAPGADKAKKQIDNAYTAANHFAGPYVADLRINGAGKVEAEFRKLSAGQQALKSGNTISRLNGWAEGGWTGPGSRFQPAGIVHADEYVISKPARQKIEAKAPGLLDHMNQTGSVPGYAGGGLVMPVPVNVADTFIPKPAFGALGGAAPGGAGGPGYRWMEAVVAKAFGLHATSDYRPGSITLSGNLSYHSMGRAADFPPSRPLAEWINKNYGRATLELITPWNDLNIKNGHRHAYSGEVYAQHAGIGRWAGNAHDHWAMANGGMITEPIFGVGASGRTYSFGENYQPERVTPMWQAGGAGGGSITVILENHGVIGSQFEVENMLAGAINNLKLKGRV